MPYCCERFIDRSYFSALIYLEEVIIGAFFFTTPYPVTVVQNMFSLKVCVDNIVILIPPHHYYHHYILKFEKALGRKNLGMSNKSCTKFKLLLGLTFKF